MSGLPQSCCPRYPESAKITFIKDILVFQSKKISLRMLRANFCERLHYFPTWHAIFVIVNNQQLGIMHYEV